MKRKSRGITRHLIFNTILVLLFLFGVLMFSRRESYNRQMAQNNEYISELSSRTAQHLSDVLESRKEALESIAYLYGQASSEEVGVDWTQLAQLEQNSGFDFIRFITPPVRIISAA